MLFAASCATLGPRTGASGQPHPANQSLPPAIVVDDEQERVLLAEVIAAARRGDVAKGAGLDQDARREWLAAGLRSVALADSNTPWRLVYRAVGARLLLQAGDLTAAARAAEQLLADPAADPASRALAARIRVEALSQQAAAEVVAGRLTKLDRADVEARGGRPVEPRRAPDGWQRLLEADDAYLALQAQDPDPQASDLAAAAAYQAASIQYAHDQFDDASRRLKLFVEAFPSSPLLGDAVGLWLQAQVVRGDVPGHAAALAAAQAAVEGERRRLAVSPPSPDLKGRGERLTKLDAQLTRERQELPFSEARRLLAAGKRAEAAAGFEAFATAFPDHPEAPRALFDAGLAWSAANDARRSAAARDLLVTRYPRTPIAGRALLLAGSDLATDGDHAGAAKRYAQYLDEFPSGEERCAAILGLGVSLDEARQPIDAARRYLAFGTDGGCAKNANAAAKALYRAAALYGKARQRVETTAALRALAGLSGVTDPEPRGYLEDARARLK
jgi:TolA-binding protein